jgi:hypothetical protein
MSPNERELCRDDQADGGCWDHCRTLVGVRSPVRFSRANVDARAAEGATTHLLVHTGAPILVPEVQVRVGVLLEPRRLRSGIRLYLVVRLARLLRRRAILLSRGLPHGGVVMGTAPTAGTVPPAQAPPYTSGERSPRERPMGVREVVVCGEREDSIGQGHHLLTLDLTRRQGSRERDDTAQNAKEGVVEGTNMAAHYQQGGWCEHDIPRRLSDIDVAACRRLHPVALSTRPRMNERHDRTRDKRASTQCTRSY